MLGSVLGLIVGLTTAEILTGTSALGDYFIGHCYLEGKDTWPGSNHL